MKVFVTRASSLASLLLALGLVGCDPYRACLKLLEANGYVALLPARDYVRPGGLIVNDEKMSTYLDAYNIAKPDEFVQKFEYDREQSASFDAALGLAAQLVKLPYGLRIDGAQPVKLEDAEIQGTRLTMVELSNIASQDSTKTAVIPHMSRGGRVFIVQEVLSIKSASLTSSDGNTLRISISSNEGISACSDQDGTSRATKNNPSGVIPVVICKTGNVKITLVASEQIPFAVRLTELVLDRSGRLVPKLLGLNPSGVIDHLVLGGHM
jgi:hypothetical protein